VQKWLPGWGIQTGHTDVNMRCIAGIILALFIASSSFGSTRREVTFERESIIISVDAKKINVEGTYIFRNSSTRLQVLSLLYPFPVDSLHPLPALIRVTTHGVIVPFDRMGQAVHFLINIEAGSCKEIVVRYEQVCLDSSACYILTTTSAWDKALDAADFEIKMPEDLSLEWTSYEIEQMIKTQGEMSCKFSRKHFMPTKNLCIRWR
jgi:hypothetical protein